MKQSTMHESTDATVPATQARDLLSRIKLIWQRASDPPDALAFLQSHAEVSQDRASMLELAYEEYCLRRESGERIDVSSFCQRFPSISRSLSRQIEVEEYLRAHPSLLSQQTAVAWPRRGDELFEFVVVEEIGRGAFARAYLCAQPGLGNRQVVVKVSHGGAIEADTMGALDHPNIMAVYSVQVDPETQLTGICMPFVGRSTLFDVIDVAFGQARQPLSASVIYEASRALARRGDRYHQLTPRMRLRRQAPYVTGVLQLVAQLAAGLAHAHDRGVLHGDLKPSNIVMSTTGMPLIVDFNLSPSRESNNLVTGGTLPYMAPEQIRLLLLGADEDDRVDERSDIFSLGGILFELLTGQPPFGMAEEDESPYQLAGRMLDSQQRGARSLRQLNPNVDHAVADLVTRCLAFDPSQRPTSMHELERSLARRLSFRCRVVRWVRQRRGLVASLLIGALAASAAGSMWWAAQPPRRVRYFQLGVQAYHQQDYHGAIESLNAALSVDAEFAEAYLARGCAAMRQFETDNYQGWLDAAYRDFTLAIRHKNHPDFINARAYCLVKKNEFEMAASEYRQLIATGAASADVYNNLAYCVLKTAALRMSHGRTQMDKFLEADSLLENARRSDKTLWQADLNLALLELKRYGYSNGDYLPRKGLEAVREVIKNSPQNSATYFFAAKLAAIIASHDADSSLVDECVRYVDRAIDLGHSLDLGKLRPPHPFSTLLNDERFLRVARRKPSGRMMSSADLVAKPSVMLSLFSINDAIARRASP